MVAKISSYKETILHVCLSSALSSRSTFHLPITGLVFTATWLSLVGIALLQQKHPAKTKHTYAENPVLGMFSPQLFSTSD